MIKAIETQYKGFRFRSRLEARWAVFFDALGLKWEYEKEGFQLQDDVRYLPDFWLPDLDCWAEVKPKEFTEVEFLKCQALTFATHKICLILDTDYPGSFHAYFPCSHLIELSSAENFNNYLSGNDFGRILFAMSARKGRLWYIFGEDSTDYWIDDAPEIAAKSARFEFGECGA